LSPNAKTMLAAVLCHPITGRLIATLTKDRVPSGSLRIRTDGPTILPRTKAQIFWGIYESAEIRMIHAHLRPDLDVLEIGASIGVVSCHAASRLSQGSRMLCVEANPDLIPVIHGNLEANHPGREIAVLNRAVDYENAPGTTRMMLSEETVGSRLNRFAGQSTNTAREVDVPASTVASLAAEGGLRDYALISDIEGAEAGFIFAEPKELEGCRQIVIELHDTQHQGQSLRWQDLLEALRERHRFRVVDSHGPVHVLAR
jgi:FkbM family methyltransferase